MSTEELDAIADRLESIADELDDRIGELLRSAVISARERGEPDLATLAEEKRIARARRSITKAVSILRHAPGD
jgi:hypothetical protein